VKLTVKVSPPEMTEIEVDVPEEVGAAKDIEAQAV
jgi:hypothetical protein